MLRDQILASARPEKCHTVRELTEELAVKELCLSLRRYRVYPNQPATSPLQT